jgi:TPP-dependent pyruvate/acetoin dehydrogenase alpha subunit
MSPPQADNINFIQLYRTMQLIRRIEEQLMAEYHPADQMRCPMHFCVGQESAPAVLDQLMRPADVMMSHYRSHGYFLAKGGSLKEMVCEFYGKATGANGGVAGSMELGSHKHNFSSGAIVGGSIIVPLGAAFAQKYTNSDAICISVIGDGSFDEGILYESMNLAALYQLPLLIICENNKYAANTEVAKRLGQPALLPKVEAMGITGEIVDGYDLTRLYETLENAISTIRRGEGPRYVEIVTYRFCAHVGSQPDDYLEYRSKDEIEAWRIKDPLPRLRNELTKEPSNLTIIKEIDDTIEREIGTAIEEAKTAPFPTLNWAMKNTWANSYAHINEGSFHELQPHFQGGQKETKLQPF